MHAMDISELRKNPHLSATAISDYLDCSLLYKLARIDRLPPEFTPDALEFGAVIHKVLAYLYQEKLTGRKHSLKELHEMFEHIWKETAEGRDDILYKEEKDFETLLLEGKELLTAYYNKIPHDDFRIVAVEEAFTFSAQGLEIPIIGVFDLIEEDEAGTIIITDWKTSARAYSIDEVDKNFQLTIYQMALRSNGYGDREILLRFDTLIKTKTPKFEQYYTTRSPTDEQRAIKKIIQVWEGIKKQVFIPNDTNWKCKGCQYKTHCDEWFRR
jgi:putative RecB family exonuclease